MNRRLQGDEYKNAGYYYLTLRVRDSQPLLGHIAATPASGDPTVALTPVGELVSQAIPKLNTRAQYTHSYITLPDRVLLMVRVVPSDGTEPAAERVVREIMVQTERQAGIPLWEDVFEPHAVRDETDYERIIREIDSAPANWARDCGQGGQ